MKNLVLVFSRSFYESDAAKELGYVFSKEELDAAEKLEVKFIGTRSKIDFYMPKTFK